MALANKLFTGLKFQRHVLNPGLLDHSLILIKSSDSDKAKVKISCRYFNAWVREEKFFSIVKEAWNIDVAGMLMFRVTKKLKNLKSRLANWQRSKNLQCQLESYVLKWSLMLCKVVLKIIPRIPLSS